jgi:hypothetical protein
LKETGRLGVHEDTEWDKLSMFMEPWTREQQEIFLTKVMKMETKEGKN